jgi:hypothetical protein
MYQLSYSDLVFCVRDGKNNDLGSYETVVFVATSNVLWSRF